MANRNAIWARAVQQFTTGYDWRIVSEEQRRERIEANHNFQEVHPWQEIICGFLGCDPNGFVTYAQLYERLEVPYERQNTTNARTIRQLAEALGWTYGQRRRNGVAMRGFWKAEVPMKEQEGGELF
jgi:predicted P-loop ATPase